MAVNFVNGQADLGNENKVAEWREQGIGNKTILTRLINKINKRAIEAEDHCQNLEEQLVSIIFVQKLTRLMILKGNCSNDVVWRT